MIALCCAASIAPLVARAQDERSKITSIRFPAGKSSATASDGLVRGESAVYSFAAKAGQTVDIRITSLENNAVFALYLPGATTRMDDGALDVQGKPLPGAEPEKETRRWSGALPASGQYLVVVSGTRGNASYDLTLSIR